MKKYIDAQLQVVHISDNDIIVTSIVSMSNTSFSDETKFGAADRFRDFEWYGE